MVSQALLPLSQGQPTQVPLVPHLRGLQGLRELVPGTGSRLISDLLSHKGAIFEAAETHSVSPRLPGFVVVFGTQVLH